MHTITTQTYVNADGCLHLEIPMGLDLAGQEIEIQIDYRVLSPEIAKPIARTIDLKAIQRICDEISALPILDTRSPDEVLGYNEIGLPE
ncbi:hypothetical protein [Altericista sp. CCNU0014]|uniref:hypothetical protein n=1 Tax=Altericista sp. CCNU0014 TaxID=3082949 RepID=UPI00384C2E30